MQVAEQTYKQQKIVVNKWKSLELKQKIYLKLKVNQCKCRDERKIGLQATEDNPQVLEVFPKSPGDI